MSKSLSAMIPDVNSVLQLEPEELAGVLIEHLNSLTPQEQHQLNRHNFLTLVGNSGLPPGDSRESQTCLRRSLGLARTGMPDCSITRGRRKPWFLHHEARSKVGRPKCL